MKTQIRVDTKSIRKKLKKENLTDAKTNFPYPIKLAEMNCTTLEMQEWLHRHRFRSWKRKGLNADFFYKDWSIIWFKSKDIALLCKLALAKKGL